ncbi:MAG TPA: helix-turn-helix transcriptional regulator [Patescibacteria group bacterium]|nr:helix-turn-helix transcriptional regulator [Patescibacteria group bacterium]
MSSTERPFRTLGWQLKLARELLKETLAEVSGAVEIDTEELVLIEQGKERPSEDVLLLLISHLRVQDTEATSLWELAGYSSSIMTGDLSDSGNVQPSIMPMDLRVVYTDMVHVMVNDYGVVMNFMQGGPANHPMAVARVGMSKKHAQNVLEILQKTLAQADAPKTKYLTQPKKNRQPKDK